ncbi:hypothetical protein HRbin36_00749 [bacterium HR36]|nr:hypothetical protein HRbin36_00749 [bacterium HR36]
MHAVAEGDKADARMVFEEYMNGAAASKEENPRQARTHLRLGRIHQALRQFTQRKQVTRAGVGYFPESGGEVSTRARTFFHNGRGLSISSVISCQDELSEGSRGVLLFFPRVWGEKTS